MDAISSIPPELEEVLADTLHKVSFHIEFRDWDLREMVDIVCKVVKLDPKFLNLIRTPLWIKSFRERWAHKLEKFKKSTQNLTLTENLNPSTYSMENALGDTQTELDLRVISGLHKIFQPSDVCSSRITASKRKFQICGQLQLSGWNCSSSDSSEDCDSDINDNPAEVKRIRKDVSDSDNENILASIDRRVPGSGEIMTLDKIRRKNFTRVNNGELELENICLACGTLEDVEAKHPLFIGGLCKDHKQLIHERFFKYDADGYHCFCSVCYMENKVVLCDTHDCRRCYCKSCLESLVSLKSFDNAVSSRHWECRFCTAGSQDGLLRKRAEWQEEIQRLYRNTEESKFSPFSVPPPIPSISRRPIRVLSLFDGIATGMVALKQLGLEVERFVASEINEDAIRLVQNKHPEVIHIGDITKLSDEEIFNMGPFDLLLGGSPCNDLSGANPRRKGLLDAEGSGCLFFDFYRVLKTIEQPRVDRSYQSARPFFWLFENVVSMKGIEKRRISRFLQCEPRMADARYVSAAARPRLFWGNLPGLMDRKITPGINDRLTVQDCLEHGRKASVEKLNTITTKFTCLYQGQSRQAPVVHDGKADILWTTEVERVFGVPEHYTDVNNLGPRERLALLGRSWSVPVVRLLLSPLKEYFAGVQPRLISVAQSSTSTWWT